MDHEKGRRREKCQNMVLLLLLSFTTNSEKRFIELQKRVSTRGNVYYEEEKLLLS